MIWRVCESLKDPEALSLVVSDVFIEWLRARTHDPTVRSLDPYRDTVMDLSILTRWRDELVRIKRHRVNEVAAELRETRVLPRDAFARDALVDNWVERTLTTDEHYQVLLDIAAAIALALEIGGFIDAVGD